jgi:hypothetical protein
MCCKENEDEETAEASGEEAVKEPLQNIYYPEDYSGNS